MGQGHHELRMHSQRRCQPTLLREQDQSSKLPNHQGAYRNLCHRPPGLCSTYPVLPLRLPRNRYRCRMYRPSMNRVMDLMPICHYMNRMDFLALKSL